MSTIDLIAGSYYSHLEVLKEAAAKRVGTEKMFFLIHFDRKIGPCLAASEADVSIKSAVIEEEIATKIDIINPQKKFYQIDEEFQKKIWPITDISEVNDEVEIWLHKGRDWISFKYFLVENQMARGGKEMFLIAFFNDKPVYDKKLKALEKELKILLQKYFNAINNPKDIYKFEGELENEIKKKENPTITPDFKIKRFYEINS